MEFEKLFVKKHPLKVQVKLLTQKLEATEKDRIKRLEENKLLKEKLRIQKSLNLIIKILKEKGA